MDPPAAIHSELSTVDIGRYRFEMINRETAKRRRALHRAAYAWANGKPHAAWEILAAEGYGHLWPEFRSEALRRARRTYVVRMARG